MDPSESDIDYAKEQISEAERRLSSIHDRVSMRGVKYSKPSDEDSPVEETTITTTNSEKLDELIEDKEEMFDLDYEEKEDIYEVDSELVDSHIQNVIIDCQLSIELAVKAMFKLTGKDHPFSHGISFEDGRTQGFYSEIPSDFGRKEDVVRVIFLTQFWDQFYELAKYGAPQLNVRPEMIFRNEDGSSAVDDAEFCIDIAKELLDYVQNKDSS